MINNIAHKYFHLFIHETMSQRSKRTEKAITSGIKKSSEKIYCIENENDTFSLQPLTVSSFPTCVDVRDHFIDTYKAPYNNVANLLH